MDHKFEVRQVDAAGGHIGGDADARPAVAHRLKRMRPLGLAQFARQAYHRKSAVREARRQSVHRRPRVGEDQRILMPMAAIMGALVLSGASILSKLISPGTILPIGIVTAVIGVPFLLALIVMRRRTVW